jgi:hypothetical protein
MAGHLDQLVQIGTNYNVRKSSRTVLLLESFKLSFSIDGQKLILLDNQVFLTSAVLTRREHWKFSSERWQMSSPAVDCDHPDTWMESMPYQARNDTPDNQFSTYIF